MTPKSQKNDQNFLSTSVRTLEMELVHPSGKIVHFQIKKKESQSKPKVDFTNFRVL